MAMPALAQEDKKLSTDTALPSFARRASSESTAVTPTATPSVTPLIPTVSTLATQQTTTEPINGNQTTAAANENSFSTTSPNPTPAVTTQQQRVSLSVSLAETINTLFSSSGSSSSGSGISKLLITGEISVSLGDDGGGIAPGRVAVLNVTNHHMLQRIVWNDQFVQAAKNDQVIV